MVLIQCFQYFIFSFVFSPEGHVKMWNILSVGQLKKKIYHLSDLSFCLKGYLKMVLVWRQPPTVFSPKLTLCCVWRFDKFKAFLQTVYVALQHRGAPPNLALHIWWR